MSDDQNTDDIPSADERRLEFSVPGSPYARPPLAASAAVCRTCGDKRDFDNAYSRSATWRVRKPAISG
jgi:ribosomal protein L40E